MEVCAVIGRSSFPGIHCRGAIDDIRNAASRLHDLMDGLWVELATDIEVEVFLVGLDGGFERVVEVLGVVGLGVAEVTKVLQVVLELGQAVGFIAGVEAG